MKYEVIATPKAERDVERLFEFLIDRNVDAAVRAERLIRAGFTSLEESPERGRPVEGVRARELVLKFGKRAYVIRYRVRGDLVIVSGVRHSLEKPRA